MEKLIDELIAKINIDSVFVIQGGTAFVRGILNFFAKNLYTDWMSPFIAVIFGQLLAYSQKGFSGEAIMYGFGLAGGAIMFEVLFKRFLDGCSVLTGRHKNNPIIQAKHKANNAKAEALIESMKKKLRLKKPAEPKEEQP